MNDFYELPLIIKRKSIFEKIEGDPTNREIVRERKDSLILSHANSVIKKMGMDSFKMRGSTKKEKALSFLKSAINAQFEDGEQYFRYFFEGAIDAGEDVIYIPIARYSVSGGKFIDADKVARDQKTARKLCMGFIKSLLSIASSCDSPKIEWNEPKDNIRIAYSKEKRPIIVLNFRE